MRCPGEKNKEKHFSELKKELKNQLSNFHKVLKKNPYFRGHYTQTLHASQEERRRGAVWSGPTFCSASAHFVFLLSCASLTLMSNRQGLVGREITSKWVSWCVHPYCRPPCRCVMLYWRRQQVLHAYILCMYFDSLTRFLFQGLPNVGKSSLFNLLTDQSTAAENFPFCTIDPSEARCAVPDERYDKLVEMWKPPSEYPAYLHVTDIAGLVRGAAEGAGLGNAFLSHIAAVDGIFHVVRVFESDEIVHVDDSVDPVRDLETIQNEVLSFLASRVQKHKY
jgi:hypothetical protein